MLLRMLRTLLLVAALLGVTGEAAAVAAVPVAPHRAESTATMSAECMEMMPDADGERSLPCDGTFKCMLAMGCISLSAMAEFGSPPAGERLRTAPGYWTSVEILRGASFAPEPDPPMILG